MKKLLNERKKATNLRLDGLSYSEIAKLMPVSKSTLSLWLRSVALSNEKQLILLKKKMDGRLKGAQSRRLDRIEKTRRIHTSAEREIKKLSEREFWLLGTALYWAEGTKPKHYRPTCGVTFSNSDPAMIKFFVNWLIRACAIKKSEIVFEIYIHKNNKYRVPAVINYWAHITHFPKNAFKKVYFKKNNIKTVRKNTNDQYFGVIRIKVKKSTDFNRRISGWIIGIEKNI